MTTEKIGSIGSAGPSRQSTPNSPRVAELKPTIPPFAMHSGEQGAEQEGAAVFESPLGVPDFVYGVRRAPNTIETHSLRDAAVAGLTDSTRDALDAVWHYLDQGLRKPGAISASQAMVALGGARDSLAPADPGLAEALRHEADLRMNHVPRDILQRLAEIAASGYGAAHTQRAEGRGKLARVVHPVELRTDRAAAAELRDQSREQVQRLRELLAVPQLSEADRAAGEGALRAIYMVAPPKPREQGQWGVQMGPGFSIPWVAAVEWTATKERRSVDPVTGAPGFEHQAILTALATGVGLFKFARGLGAIWDGIGRAADRFDRACGVAMAAAAEGLFLGARTARAACRLAVQAPRYWSTIGAPGLRFGIQEFREGLRPSGEVGPSVLDKLKATAPEGPDGLKGLTRGWGFLSHFPIPFVYFGGDPFSGRVLGFSATGLFWFGVTLDRRNVGGFEAGIWVPLPGFRWIVGGFYTHPTITKFLYPWFGRTVNRLGRLKGWMLRKKAARSEMPWG